jgi:phosphoribosyl 1,2-cyclic phosphodiesterase
MMPRFCILASGSSGNAAFLQADGFGLLIDIGLGPRLLGSRLAAVGASWKNVSAVLLTHVHADHWKDRCLAQLRTQKIPLYCHAAHADVLSFHGPAFAPLKNAGLVRFFESEAFALPNGLSCKPLAVPHDSDPTYAFRIDGVSGLFSEPWSVGYAADLGNAPAELIDLFREVDLLALEFNHDEDMERRSGRPRRLIDRVLGDEGHLSNRQAAESLRSILDASTTRSLRQVIQLHLSHHCNRPSLAQTAAKKVLDGRERPIGLCTAHQDRPTKFVELGAR